MIWHIVRFDFSGCSSDQREELEQRITGLAALDEVAWLRVARDVDEPSVTGLLTGFADREALQGYRKHPRHLPVIEALRDAGVGAVRLDVETPDDATALPA
ncbi:MAG: Dabb family protein [Egibacteraceae bacterium]